MSLFGKKNDDGKKSDVKSAKPANETKKMAEKKSMKELYSEKTAATEVKEKGSEQKIGKYNSAYRVLAKPLITEKASVMGGENKYFFAVSKDANKIEITKAIKQVYGVSPASVNIINVRGKKVRSGRTMGQRKDWKKAIITLPKGVTIKIYEGV